MAKSKLSPSDIKRAVELRQGGATWREIGEELGVDHTSAMRAVKKHGTEPADMNGGPPPRQLDEVIDRSEVDGTVSLCRHDRPPSVDELREAAGLGPEWIAQFVKSNAWEGFYKVDTPEGHRKVRLWQSKASFKRAIEEDLRLAIETFAGETVKPMAKSKLLTTRKPVSEEGFCVAWGMYDAHLGSFAWAQETRHADFDINIAEKRVLNSIDDMILELAPYQIDRLIIPMGNDFMHYDGARMSTATGDHRLDTDTRYPKAWKTALRCLIYQVERALELCDNIEVLWVPGNHDSISSLTLCGAVEAYFRNDDRVDVDLGASPRKYRFHGGTILGFEHGQKIKPDRMPLIIAQECKKHWAASTWVEFHIGHRHQRAGTKYAATTPVNGVLVRTNPALCSADAWHSEQGFIGEPRPSVEAHRYDELGYRGTHVTWARDER